MEHGVVRSVEDGVKNNLRVAFDRFSLLPGVELKDVYTLSWTVLNGTNRPVAAGGAAGAVAPQKSFQKYFFSLWYYLPVL